MEVDAFLADWAEAVQGKIYGMGIGWNTIYAGSFPVQHPRASVGITVHVPYTATNQMHTLALHLEGPDGERFPLGQAINQVGGEPTTVYELGCQFNVGRPPLLPPGDEQIISLAMTINNLNFPVPQMFTWVVSVDGTPMRRLPMRVQLLNQPAQLAMS